MFKVECIVTIFNKLLNVYDWLEIEHRTRHLEKKYEFQAKQDDRINVYCSKGKCYCCDYCSLSIKRKLIFSLLYLSMSMCSNNNKNFFGD